MIADHLQLAIFNSRIMEGFHLNNPHIVRAEKAFYKWSCYSKLEEYLYRNVFVFLYAQKL
jgi:hypothetical protein